MNGSYYIERTYNDNHLSNEHIICDTCIILKRIEYCLYQLLLNKEYDPLKDEELKKHLPELYLQLNDLKSNQLTKQGSKYFIQKTFMSRLLTSLPVERDSTLQLLLYENNQFPNFSLKLERYGNEYAIDVDRFNEFKEFMKPQPSTETVIKSEHQGCYLIQLYCDKDTNKYKIGKSKNILTRLKSTEYRNAFIYLAQFVTNENECEKELIEEFTKKFTLIKEDSQGNFGNETFAGNINDMMDEFYRICSHYRM